MLKGTGTIQANLTNSGELAPGNSPGIIHIDGDYTQTATGTLEIEVGGLTPGTEHDKVIVTGTATLDGRFEFPLINNPTRACLSAAIGNEITFLHGQSITGAPKGVFAPNLASVAPNVGFVVIKNNQDLRLRFVEPTDVHFVDNSGPGSGLERSCKVGRQPRAHDCRQGGPQPQPGALGPAIEVTSADAAAYQLTVHDQSSPITVAVKNGKTSAAAVGDVTIGENATIELGTAGNLMDQGTLATSSTRTVLLNDGGMLKGNGVVSAGDLVVADGTVAPGFSVGHLDVAGNYLQGGNGVLAIDVDGAAAAGEFDTIAVTGAATLDGTLRIDASQLTAAVPGTSVEIITAGGIAPGTRFAEIENFGSDDIYFAPPTAPPQCRLRSINAAI